jgi:glycosyltransferase involved in cell wall biosynthesis
MKAIHQFLPTFEPGAIGSYALEVQSTLHEAGYESEIFAEFAKGGFEQKFRVHTDYGRAVPARADDVLLYQMAIGSNVADFVYDQPQRLVVLHHNITPVEYYQQWDPGSTYGMAWGRDQLRKLADRAVLGLAVSEYNRRELEQLHYRRTATVPFLTDLRSFDHDLDDAAVERARAQKAQGGTDWLFVGWLSPHKCQHDIIRAFAAYRSLYDPKARLHLVGRVGVTSYADACRALAQELGVGDAVTFPGRISGGELGAAYLTADVLVSMSEHEGVGIPLLEAMYHRLPIVAFAAAAVPETVGNAGVVLARKRPATIAAAVNRVITDAPLRQALVRRGQERMARHAIGPARQALLASLRTVD